MTPGQGRYHRSLYVRPDRLAHDADNIHGECGCSIDVFIAASLSCLMVYNHMFSVCAQGLSSSLVDKDGLIPLGHVLCFKTLQCPRHATLLFARRSRLTQPRFGLSANKNRDAFHDHRDDFCYSKHFIVPAGYRINSNTPEHLAAMISLLRVLENREHRSRMPASVIYPSLALQGRRNSPKISPLSLACTNEPLLPCCTDKSETAAPSGPFESLYFTNCFAPSFIRVNPLGISDHTKIMITLVSMDKGTS